jgi:hypothetical protein
MVTVWVSIRNRYPAEMMQKEKDGVIFWWDWVSFGAYLAFAYMLSKLSELGLVECGS